MIVGYLVAALSLCKPFMVAASGEISVYAAERNIHEDGWCAMYDNCGKASAFGSPLPCAQSLKASKLSDSGRTKLEAICGSDLAQGAVCCAESQVDSMISALKRVDPILSSCPACARNFYDFVCGFTCLPNQSVFVDITKTQISLDRKLPVVAEMNLYISPSFADSFYQSCKNVKFSATEGFAMDLIGGGATNYSQFLKFLGDAKPFLGGSPFQTNYIYSVDEGEVANGIKLRDGTMRACDDEQYKCACSDCASSCPNLGAFDGFNQQKLIFGISYYAAWVISVWCAIIMGTGVFHMRAVKNHEALANQTPLAAHAASATDDATPNAEMANESVFSAASVKNVHSKLLLALDKVFYNFGLQCSTFPALTISTSLFCALALSSGMIWLQFETDPVKLWVGPGETTLKNQQYFEANFGEWFRILQVIVSSKNISEPVLSWDTVEWWFKQELRLESINPNVSYSDICFKPLGDTCALESFTQYFHGNIDYIDRDNWQNEISSCARSPVGCLPSFQQPLKSNILFDRPEVLDARAFIVTLLVNSNSSDANYTNSVISYEHLFQEWASQLAATNEKIEVAYNTEVSISEELGKSSKLDVKTIAGSYFVMFLYASIALGGRIPTSVLDLSKTRFALGLSGILIVILSVTSTLGLFSYFGYKATLLVAEVIPFLVLAIGVDNIFLMVNALGLVSLDSGVEQAVLTRVATAVSKVAPSCLASAIVQIVMALLSTAVDMPAVRNFALYSAVCVAINFALQMSTFVALLSLDQKRLEEGRIDCVPWMALAGRIQLGQDPIPESRYSLSKWTRETYAPWLLSKRIRRIVLAVGIIWFGVLLSLAPNIEFGLDQRLAVPRTSYLVDYFDAVYEYLNVGPPIFVVMPDTNITHRAEQQKVCGKFGACSEFLVANIMEQEYKRGNVSTVASPASNWLDDFLSWLNPTLDECCRVERLDSDGVFTTSPRFCSADAPPFACEACFLHSDPPYDTTMEAFPQGPEFMLFFHQWIEQGSDVCPLGGKAPYGSSVSYSRNNVSGSYLRASHRPLRSQADFIEASANARRISSEIELKSGVEVFLHSPFYVFFAQYRTIVATTATLLICAVMAICVVTTVALGSLQCAVIICGMVVSILAHILGVCAVWNISLNGLTVVNLIICAGLAVEFTIHIARAYMLCPENSNQDTTAAEDRISRAEYALGAVGPAVLEGITGTKAIGVAVLALAQSRIFQVYYFRMWATLVFVAGLHALVLLPVTLGFMGPTRKL